MQAQKTVQKNAPFAAPGVEPELFFATPRRVVTAKSFHRRRLWVFNLIVGSILLGYYVSTVPGLADLDGLWAVCFMPLAVTVATLMSEDYKVRRDFRLLSEGYAKRATVTAFVRENLDDNGYAEIKYEYRTTGTGVTTQSLTVTSADAAKHDFAVGATFTVLHMPGDPYSPVPYFRVTEAMIPGAPPPKIAPP